MPPYDEEYPEEGSDLLSIQEQVDKLIVRVLQLETRINELETQDVKKPDILFCSII